MDAVYTHTLLPGASFVVSLTIRVSHYSFSRCTMLTFYINCLRVPSARNGQVGIKVTLCMWVYIYIYSVILSVGLSFAYCKSKLCMLALYVLQGI